MCIKPQYSLICLKIVFSSPELPQSQDQHSWDVTMILRVTAQVYQWFRASFRLWKRTRLQHGLWCQKEGIMLHGEMHTTTSQLKTNKHACTIIWYFFSPTFCDRQNSNSKVDSLTFTPWCYSSDYVISHSERELPVSLRLLISWP